MEFEIDRIEFYNNLKYCESLNDIKKLIDNIENDELLIKMKEKYEQFIEFNKEKNVEISNLIVVLECAFLDFIRENNKDGIS